MNREIPNFGSNFDNLNAKIKSKNNGKIAWFAVANFRLRIFIAKDIN
jgi:hypothetical protein